MIREPTCLITVRPILYFHRNVASVAEVFNFVNKVLCLFNKSFQYIAQHILFPRHSTRKSKKNDVPG